MNEHPDAQLRPAGSVGPPDAPVANAAAKPLPDLQRRPAAGVDATDFLIPKRVSAWSLISCYFGLIGVCMPLFGIIFAAIAFVCGLIALHKWRKANSYGAVTSNIRAILGLIMGFVGIALWGTIWVKLLWLK
jgi:hypothetical protein